VKIAEHYNAYTAFSVIVPAVEAGTHEVAVLVDNSFGGHSALHVPNDYYTYGGIIRPVVVEEIPDVFIERIEFTPSMAGTAWQASINVYVRNIGSTDAEAELRGTLAGASIDMGKRRVPAGQTAIFHTTESFIEANAWSNAAPNLYLLQMLLFSGDGNEPVDDLIERVGFRERRATGKFRSTGKTSCLKASTAMKTIRSPVPPYRTSLW